MRTALLLTGLLLTVALAPLASAGPGDVTVHVAGESVHYHDSNPMYCSGEISNNWGPVTFRTGAGGQWDGECSHEVDIL